MASIIVEIIGWAIPVIMLPVIASRHLPTAAIAWLIFLFFQPWLGLTAYLLFGENRVIRRLAKSYCQRITEIRSAHPAQSGVSRLLYPPIRTDARLDRITERLSCLPAAAGNSVEVLDDGFDVIDRMLEDIDSSVNHVHLLFYIFQDDILGRRVAEALGRAAARGVRVRLVVDAFGSRSLARELGQWMRERGVEFHDLMSVNPFRRHHTRLDLRNHRKLLVVDGKIAYTGSQNIEFKDYDSDRADAWHDIMVRITGPVVSQFQMVFVEDWYLSSGEMLEGDELFPTQDRVGDIPVQVIPTGPTNPNTTLRDILIALISSAREEIIITSPYFIPDEPFRVALYLAGLRGTRIDLLIPRHTDHPVLGAVARAYITSLVDSGMNIHFHRGLLHSKTMTVDNSISVIGTANFDRRSFFLHSELSLILYGHEVTERLRARQVRYIAQSDPLDPPRWRRRSPFKRTRDDILKILSPIL